MVLHFESVHTFDHDFATATTAYYNRYPNPYTKHVQSMDMLDCHVDSHGCLWTTRMMKKTGRLPKFIKPLLGNSLSSWVIEKSVINPETQTMWSYTANLDHRRFIKVEEYVKYRVVDGDNDKTTVKSKVIFSSNLFGLKQRVEQWSHNKFTQNIKNSRAGMMYVMNSFKEKRALWMKNNQNLMA